MFFGLLLTLFIINCALMIGLILIQQSKSSMGLGSLGGGTQMLFGGSGGQDAFQKTTWVMGAIFLIGSLFLSIMKTQEVQQSRFLKHAQSVTLQQEQAPQAPQQ